MRQTEVGDQGEGRLVENGAKENRRWRRRPHTGRLENAVARFGRQRRRRRPVPATADFRPRKEDASIREEQEGPAWRSGLRISWRCHGSFPPRMGLSGTWQPAARLAVALHNNPTVATKATTTPRHRCARTARDTSTLLPISTHVGERGLSSMVGTRASHCQWAGCANGFCISQSGIPVALVSEIVIW